MTDVTIHVSTGDWCVHFVITATQIPIGPWLLFESSDEIKAKVFTWGSVSDQEMQEYENNLRRWSHGSAHMLLDDRQLRALAARARGWPWTGYELIQMRNAGKYPPQRLLSRNSIPASPLVIICGNAAAT
jgi:hypothetical protein